MMQVLSCVNFFKGEKNMKMVRRSFVALTSIAMATGCMASASQPAKSTPPNVVFFIADDMLPKHFNCLPEGKGKNLTPNIDRLASEGTILLEGHCASPICTPSRYNVLTGRYASRAQNEGFLHQTKREGQSVVEFNTHILKTDITLPKLLKKAGYTTGMSGKNHVVDVSPNPYSRKNFPDIESSAKRPENVSKLKAAHDHVCQAIREAGFDYVDRVFDNNPHYLGLHDLQVQNMDWITEGGVNFIKQDHDRPFFLYFATTVPHGPTDGPHSWNADPLICPLGFLDKAPTVQPARETIPERLTAAGFPVNADTANMLWLDDALGALINEIEAKGELDNTVIFFYSDHGQMSKGTLYQGGVHNPSIVWKKGGFSVGPTCDALVHVVDFAPTILDMAGYKYAGEKYKGQPIEFDGESFVPYLNNQPQTGDRVMYFELGYARGIRKGNLKYMAIRYPEHLENMPAEERADVLEKWNAERIRKHMELVTTDPTQPFSHLTAIPGGGHAESKSTGSYPGYFDRDQLYDLSTDPREQKNLANDPEYKQKLEEMQREMKKVLDTLPGNFDV
jgi:arylsulfatase A